MTAGCDIVISELCNNRKQEKKKKRKKKQNGDAKLSQKFD